jgi:phosphatidylserine/phosphatidylglycerophosphate/cardiolipin synthase-like enzyme
MTSRQPARRPVSISPRAVLILIVLLVLVYMYQIGAFDRWLAPLGLASTHAPVSQSSAGGAIQVFFTTPTLVYPDVPAQRGASPLAEAVIADVHAATLSIDVAAFDFDLSGLADALIAARRRGVAVRMIVDSENLQSATVANETGRLQAAGIPITFQRTAAFMHNKFLVIDQTITWTGSWNMTFNGTYRNNNNFQRFVSRDISADYAAEFGQMFAGAFGASKARRAPFPHVQVGAASVAVYFSPEDGAARYVLGRLSQAQRSIRFMTFSFTSDSVAEVMLQKQAAGLQVQGVFESQNANGTGAEFKRLQSGGVHVLTDGNCYIMHHKVIIIDDRIVMTGSYNFSSNADRYNDENLVIIDDPVVAQQYIQEFDRVYAHAQSPSRCQ